MGKRRGETRLIWGRKWRRGRFPTVGKRCGDFSNDWKKFQTFFQRLEKRRRVKMCLSRGISTGGMTGGAACRGCVEEGGAVLSAGMGAKRGKMPQHPRMGGKMGGGGGKEKAPRSGTGAGMVEAAGVEPASGNASPMLLRAYSAIGSSPCGLPADRPPAPPASCWVSSLFPEARNRDQPAE